MYAHSREQTITDFSDETIERGYDRGFVFTRPRKGNMHEVRSLRIDLSRFALTSENRRILKQSEEFSVELQPLPYAHYHWSIGKMASDFYSRKFGAGVMSANKAKELMTDPARSNMNAFFVYRHTRASNAESLGSAVGYCLAFQTPKIVHYAYPFYQFHVASTNPVSGIMMMTKAICWSKEDSKHYIYLGSVSDPKSLYKLQFQGLEWWNIEQKNWSIDLAALKTSVAARP